MRLAHYVRAINLSATSRAIRGEMHPSETFCAANAMRFDALAMYLDARRISSLRPRQCCKNEARKKAFAHLSKLTNDLVLLAQAELKFTKFYRGRRRRSLGSEQILKFASLTAPPIYLVISR